MKRLLEQNINTPEEYDNIFKQRLIKGIDPVDFKRWHLLLRHFRGGKLVDLGCLDSLVPLIAKHKFNNTEAFGLDHSRGAIKWMSENCPGVNYVEGDVYETKFPSNFFDYVVAGEVLEHLEDPEKFIKEAVRILKKGGVLALSTPSNEVIEPGAVDKEHHLWSFERKDIQKLLQPFGVSRTKIFHWKSFPGYKYFFPIILGYLWKK